MQIGIKPEDPRDDRWRQLFMEFLNDQFSVIGVSNPSALLFDPVMEPQGASNF